MSRLTVGGRDVGLGSLGRGDEESPLGDLTEDLVAGAIWILWQLWCFPFLTLAFVLICAATVAWRVVLLGEALTRWCVGSVRLVRDTGLAFAVRRACDSSPVE